VNLFSQNQNGKSDIVQFNGSEQGTVTVDSGGVRLGKLLHVANGS